MSRHKNGSLIGRAAATEKRDQWRERNDQYLKWLKQEQNRREAEEISAEADAVRRCIYLEGEQSFYRWWNSDDVPGYGPRLERIVMVEERIRLIEHKASLPKENEDEKNIQGSGENGREKSQAC